MQSSRFFLRILPLLGVALCASLAHADELINASNFNLRTLGAYDSMNTAPQQLSILSDSNGVTRINMAGLSQSLLIDSYNGSSPGGQTSVWADASYRGMFDMQVRPGYRLTGFSWTSRIMGELLVGEMPPRPINDLQVQGSAMNEMQMSIGIAASENGPLSNQRALSLNNVTNLPAATLQASALNWQDHFVFNITGHTVAASVNTQWIAKYWDGWEYLDAFSYADINPQDSVLTLYTSPVPEPETYAMMLAGLAGLAWRARRRSAK